jgi:hypothetical protein
VKNNRPYSTYKAFGGFVAAFALAKTILVVLQIGGAGGEPPEPLRNAILPAIIGGVGLVVFILADRKLRG